MTTETTQEAGTRYRQKGADVEARQLLDDLRNHTAIAAWVEGGGGQALIPFTDPCLYVDTADGQERADIGDWIVRFPAGTFQVIPPDKFDAAFESAQGRTTDPMFEQAYMCRPYSTRPLPHRVTRVTRVRASLTATFAVINRWLARAQAL